MLRRWLNYSLLLWALLGSSQDIPTGTWRGHFSYTHIRNVESNGSTLACASENALFLLNLDDFTTSKMDRTMGLSSAGLTALQFTANGDYLLLGYNSGVIDLISNSGDIYSIRDYAESDLTGSRVLYDVVSTSQMAYFASDNGVLVVNLGSRLLTDNYRNVGPSGAPLGVIEVEILGDSLLVLSDDGIRGGLLSSNLLDFNNWEFQNGSGINFRELVVFNQKAYAIHNGNELWRFNGNWVNTGLTFPGPVIQFKESNNRLLGMTSSGIYEVGESSIDLISSHGLTPNDFEVLPEGIFLGDQETGLVEISSGQLLSPDGPISDEPTKLVVTGNRTYSLFGPEVDDYDGTIDGAGYSFFDGRIWESDTLEGFSNLTDVVEIGGVLYFSSLGLGIRVNSTGALISGLALDPIYGLPAVTDLEWDGSRLWAGLYSTSESLMRIDLESESATGYSSTISGVTRPKRLVALGEDLLWVSRSDGDGGGVIAFRYETSEVASFGTGEGLPTSSITDIEQNDNEEIWVATPEGLASYFEAGFPFSGSSFGVPFFDGRPLLSGLVVNDVLFDGGDRLWVATDDGVWVFDPSLSRLEQRFTVEDSPLPSSDVRQLAYNPKSGEVFMLTGNGMVSFRSASSVGSLSQEGSIRIFPNPVRRQIHEGVSVAGLVKNAEVKITDLTGRLVAELQANGGTAFWNLRRYDGDEVQMGVYLVFSSSGDGRETIVGKIALIQ